MSRTSFHRSSMDRNLFIKSGRILVVTMRRFPTFREFVAAGPKWNFCRRAKLVVPETAGDCVSQQPSVRIDIILQTLRHWVVLQGPLAFCITDPGGERVGTRGRGGTGSPRNPFSQLHSRNCRFTGSLLCSQMGNEKWE